MYHLIQAAAIEPKVRLEICSRCWRRPRHSESLPPAVPRECQATCPIFQLLPALVKRAELIDPMIASPEHAVRTMIHRYCRDTPGGDIGTLATYGPKLAHIVAESVENAG
jgi:hypothetical protein